MKKTFLFVLMTMLWSVAAWSDNVKQTISTKAGDSNLVPVTKTMTFPENPGLLYEVQTFEEVPATKVTARQMRHKAPTADDEDFTATTVEGIVMKFKVISAADKTCLAGALPLTSTSSGSNYTCIDRNTEGEVTIPSEVEGYRVIAIGNAAFYYCQKITKVNIPSTVVSIGTSAFGYCDKLTSLHIPASVQTISFNSLRNLKAVTSIVVDGANPIYDSRDNCNAVIEKSTNILVAGCGSTVIPSTVTSLAKNAFFGCANLTSINIPASITKLDGDTSYGVDSKTWGAQVFDYCPSLQTITVDAANTIYDSRDNCNAIIETATSNLILGSCSTVIPASVKTIGSGAFAGRDLKSITIPKGITDIYWGAFSGTSLTSVIIPSTVRYMGSTAFNIWSLLDVTTQIETPFSIQENVFSSNTYTNGTLHVPDGTKGQYKNTDGWKNFQNIDGTGGDDDTEESAITSTFVSWSLDGANDYYVFGTMISSEGHDWYAGIDRPSATVEYIDDATSGDKGVRIVDNDHSQFVIHLDGIMSVSGKIQKIVIRGMGNFQAAEGQIYDEATNNMLEYNGNDFTPSTTFTDYVIPFAGTTDYENVHLKLHIFGTPHMIIQSIKIVQEEGSSEIPMSGTTGDLSWKVEQLSSNVLAYQSGSWVEKPSYRLTISGKGYMPNYNNTGYDSAQQRPTTDAPWNPFPTITEIVIEEGVRSIGNRAFYANSDQLYQVTLPSTIETIGIRVFVDGSSIVKINFPEGLTTISDYAFPWCSNLDEVNLPSTLVNLWPTSFKGNGIKTLTVASDNPMYDSRNNCNAIILTSENKLFMGTPNTVIPATVTVIGTSAFENNNNLKSFTIPDNVTTIQESAFGSCYELKEITIGSGVTNIKSEAFRTCNKLENAYCYADPTALTWEDYDNTQNLMSGKDTKTNFHVVASYLTAWQEKYPNLNATYVGDLPDPAEVTPGDADGNGTIEANDIAEVVIYMLRIPSTKFKMKGADANQDN